MKTLRFMARLSFALALLIPNGFAQTQAQAQAPTQANNIALAPPAFGPDKIYVPMDISSINIDYLFDIASKKATGVATVKFSLAKEGKPFFDIVPDATALTVNGEELSPRAIQLINPKIRITVFRFLNKVLPADTEHEMVISYDISDKAKFGDGTINMGFFVSDLDDRSFFEKFGPSNFQFDQIAHTFNVTVKGAKQEHRIFANGKVTAKGDSSWQVVFPSYYNTSTLYFHLVPSAGVKVVEAEYRGRDKTIPVVLYSKSGRNLEKYRDQTLAKLASLEKRFGPTIHDSFTIYISGSGGMEYSGATITSARALNHELTHSWYARGVFPSDGSSSWVDEAVASWQDAGYKRAGTEPTGNAVTLIASTPYVRATNRKAYTRGKDLMSQLDYKLRDKGGIVPILASFYQSKKKQVFTTEMFLSHLEKEAGESMKEIFAKYVYGKGYFDDDEGFAADGSAYPARVERPSYTMAIPSQHPRRLTAEELYDIQ